MKTNIIRPSIIYNIIIVLGIFISQGQLFAQDREIKDLTEKLVNQVAKSGKKTIAIVDFVDLQGNATELGRYIAEEISVEFSNNDKKIEIIDRTHLKSLMKEHKFSMSGLVDPDTVKKLGKIAGVDAIVTGSVTPFGDNYRITCKVIATDTARIVGGGRIDIAKTQTINNLGTSEISDGQGSTQKEKKSARQDRQEDEMWNAVKDSNNPSLVLDYLSKYPQGTYSNAANALIRKLSQKPATADNVPSQIVSTSQSPIYRIVPVVYGGSKHDDLTRELADAISGVPFAKVEVGGQPRTGERIVSVVVSRLSDRVIDNPDHAGSDMARQFFGGLVDAAMANIPKKLIEANANIAIVVNDNAGGRVSEAAEVTYRTDAKKGSDAARSRAISEALTDASGRLVTRISGGIPSKKAIRVIDDYAKSSAPTE